ncbi:MAG TPA: GxxExxY protein [Candidatus Hydrogenedentes bacterium]|nr:GxxExxY protein [Candidatus Hydrogenedentota bacterium]HQH51951.1 GxxExxY protein [Candidatus Hydrogenedentota bacterium]HQM48629.1 GxxExxY protein [Candidatus Hydrogenedentota bacterium]
MLEGSYCLHKRQERTHTETQGTRRSNPPKQNEIGSVIVACAVALHRETGPGLLETVCEAVLARDSEVRGLRVARQVPIPIELRRRHFSRVFV